MKDNTHHTAADTECKKYKDNVITTEERQCPPEPELGTCFLKCRASSSPTWHGTAVTGGGSQCSSGVGYVEGVESVL